MWFSSFPLQMSNFTSIIWTSRWLHSTRDEKAFDSNNLQCKSLFLTFFYNKCYYYYYFFNVVYINLQLATGWFTPHVLEIFRLCVAVRFLSVYPNAGAESFLKSASSRLEKSKRAVTVVKEPIVNQQINRGANLPFFNFFFDEEGVFVFCTDKKVKRWIIPTS